MNITLTVVVAAIVILITALVVITIFGGGIKQVGGIAEAESMCRSSCESACRATGRPPITWEIPTVRDPSGETVSCKSLVGDCKCDGTGSGSGSPDTDGSDCMASDGHCTIPSACTTTEMGQSDCPSGQTCCANT